MKVLTSTLNTRSKSEVVLPRHRRLHSTRAFDGCSSLATIALSASLSLPAATLMTFKLMLAYIGSTVTYFETLDIDMSGHLRYRYVGSPSSSVVVDGESI